MMFLRLFSGCVLQLLPFSMICLFPFKNHFRISNKKTITISIIIVIILGIIFASATIPISQIVGVDYSFAASNGIFFLCLIPCFIWYIYIVKDIWKKKLFVFSFTIMSAAAMILVNNTFTTIIQKNQDIDNLPYYGTALPILAISTLIALPLIIVILKKGFMPTAEYLTSNEYTGLSVLSLVLLIILFAVYIPTDFTLVTNITYLVPYIAIVVAIFVIYYVVFKMFGLSKSQLISERELAQSKLNFQIQSEQYNRVTDKIAETRRIRHDSKHHFVAIKQYLINNDIENASKYLDKQIEKIDNLTLERYCENEIINAMLSYYSNIANEHDIKFSIKVNCPKNISINSSDLTVVIGNLLDNAYSAARRADKGNRLIDFNIVNQGKMLAITVDNSFDGTINYNNDKYLSTKANHNALGIGSIKQIAKKYDGGTEFSHEDNLFHASVMLRTNK